MRSTVIPNPVNPQFTEDKTQDAAQQDKTFRVVVIAQNLSDPVKDVATTVDAFTRAGLASSGAELVLVGHGGEGFIGAGIRAAGSLSSEGLQTPAGAIRCSGGVLTRGKCPSFIAEAASAGVLPIVRAVGGMPEMVALLGHGHTFTSMLRASETLLIHGIADSRLPQPPQAPRGTSLEGSGRVG